MALGQIKKKKSNKWNLPWILHVFAPIAAVYFFAVCIWEERFSRSTSFHIGHLWAITTGEVMQKLSHFFPEWSFLWQVGNDAKLRESLKAQCLLDEGRRIALSRSRKLITVKMNIFFGGFWFLSAVCAVMYFVTRAALPAVSAAGFTQFQRSYLLVYLLAMGMYIYLYCISSQLKWWSKKQQQQQNPVDLGGFPSRTGRDL